MAAVPSLKERAAELRLYARMLRAKADSYRSLGREQNKLFMQHGNEPFTVRSALNGKFGQLQAALVDIHTNLDALNFQYPIEVRVRPGGNYYRAIWQNSSPQLEVLNHGGDAAFDADGGGTTNIFAANDVVRINGGTVEQQDIGGNRTEVFSVNTPTTDEKEMVIASPTTIAAGNENNLRIRLIER